MFTRKVAKKPDFENINTLLGEGIEFSEGNIKGCGNVQIDGILFGDVDIDGNLVIGETGYIKGNVNATYAKVSGRLEGDVMVTGLLHVTQMGNLQGDIECGSIIIEENAVFCGVCNMMGKSEKRRAKREENTAVQVQQG